MVDTKTSTKIKETVVKEVSAKLRMLSDGKMCIMSYTIMIEV